MQKEQTRIKSFVRIKPKAKVLKISDNKVEYNNKNNKIFNFEFDNVFGPEAKTADIFKILVPHIEHKEPIDLTILAYGQTGSGKTFTVSGIDEQFGLIQMIVEFLLGKFNDLDSFKVSFIEVYNEKVFDGIDGKEKDLRECKEKFYIPDLSKKGIRTMNEFQDIWKKFDKSRKHGMTHMNNRSSRSHIITRIETTEIVINLVDLAGSENNKRTGNIGERMKESQCINTSLFVLNKVINSIINKDIRIPFRDSKLTRILKETLSGEGKCFIIATVIDEIDEDGLTANTLSFASKSRQIITVERVKENKITKSDIENNSKIYNDLKTMIKGNLNPVKSNFNNNNTNPVKSNFNENINNSSVKSNFNENINNSSVKSSFNENINNIPVKSKNINLCSIKNKNVNNIHLNSFKSNKSDSSSLSKCSLIEHRIEMTPITKQKSKNCFLLKAKEYEQSGNFKLALETYKTINKIAPSDEFERKITELSKRRKLPCNFMSTPNALHCLNFGSFIEIKKLNGIGDKRAKVIFDFVQNGNIFEGLEDLKILFNEKVYNKILEGIRDE